MKLALISISIDTTSPPLGICSIATYLEKYADFKDTVIVDVNYDNIMEKLEKVKPDIIGIGAMTVYYPSAISLAKKIKAKFDVPLLIGANHISTLPESLDKIFDIAVIGEGEETMRELVELYREKRKYSIEDLKKVKGIAFYDNGKLIKTEPRPLITPLDKIPIPNRDYLNKGCFKKARSFGTGNFEVNYRIPTSRGCPYRCRFCSPTIMWGSSVRFHSIERIVEEIKIGINEYHATYIAFSDDLFAVSKDRLKQLYARLKEENLLGKVKFGGSIRANLVDDEFCILLKKLGFLQPITGYESGNEEILKYLKAGSVTVKDNYRAIKLLEKHKMGTRASFIFGSPNETLEQMRDTLKLIKFAYKHKAKFIYIYLLKPFPGTEVWEIAKKRNLVSNHMDWETLTLFIEGVNDMNRPLMLDKDIDIEEFKKIHDKALLYSRLVSMKRLLRAFIRHPIWTIKGIGNPFIYIRKNLIHANTLKFVKPEK